MKQMKSLGTINASPSHLYKLRLCKQGDRPALSPITNGKLGCMGDIFDEPLTEENDTLSRGCHISHTPAPSPCSHASLCP